MLSIGKDMVVRMRYLLKNGRGEVLEDHISGDPVRYIHGVVGGIEPLLQAQLEGLRTGDRKTVYLRKGDGGADDDFVLEVVIVDIRAATPGELMAGRPAPVRSGMRVHVLSGFLGSGKTTAIGTACRLLMERGRRVAVITNDQGSKLVDGGFFRSMGIPLRQVVDGCFCCHYNELDRSIRALQGTERPDVIFAESVGSCTDIIATVINPLLRYRLDLRVSLSVMADGLVLLGMLKGESLFNESVRYIYAKQLEEARILVITKTDLLDGAARQELELLVLQHFKDKRVLWQHSYDGEDVSRWLGLLEEEELEGVLAVPEVDYSIYGDGEAELAWLDQEVEVGGRGDAASAAVALAESIHASILEKGYPVGHLKFLLNGELKLGWTSGEEKHGGEGVDMAGDKAILLINARIQTKPERLSGLVKEAMVHIAEREGCRIETKSVSGFRPGFPVPTHRISGMEDIAGR